MRGPTLGTEHRRSVIALKNNTNVDFDVFVFDYYRGINTLAGELIGAARYGSTNYGLGFSQLNSFYCAT